ncbi:MAG: PIN domain-containing protein [Betaproteobacteria bacterium]
MVGLEFASVLERKVRTRELAKAAARAAMTQFRDHERAGLFSLLSVGGAHYARARRWIETFRAPLRTLDALHLALAARSGRTLLTADVQLARAARRLRVHRRLLRS